MKALVLLSDFGLTERFVASMKGVAFGVEHHIPIFDLTHSIAPYDIWDAGLTLAGTIPYWPKGTVFVSVVDPGVGTTRKSLAVLTKSGHLIITPDNGTLTLIAEHIGLEKVIEIDDQKNRLSGSEAFHTFYGRDVYVFNGARLAAGKISLDDLGKELKEGVYTLAYPKPESKEGEYTSGIIAKVEQPYGNLVTNISKNVFERFCRPSTDINFMVQVWQGNKQVFQEIATFSQSFGGIPKDHPLLYVDSINLIGLALNQGNMAKKYRINSGNDWRVKISNP